MAESIRINEILHQKQNEQTALVDSLMQQIHNQNQVISQLQQAPMRSAASGPSNGTEFFQVSTPVGRKPFDPEPRVGSEICSGDDPPKRPWCAAFRLRQAWWLNAFRVRNPG